MAAPIFVVGTMRSGSTLLRLILDSHDDIAIGEETGFAGAIAATRNIPNWRYGAEWFTRLGWTEQELDQRLHDFYAPMFERHATTQGKKRWGDKTPFHSWHMVDLARIFPDAVFVGIVRHPAAVVASLVKKFHYGVPEAADYWTATNLEVLRRGAGLGAGRFALVRYEDVVGTPEPALRQLMDWLGEHWTDSLLRHQEVQAAKGAPRLVDGSTSTRAPIDPERANSWRLTLTPPQQHEVAARTGTVAEFLGYDPADARNLAALTADSLLLTGDAVASRHRDWRPPFTLAPADTQAGTVVADTSVEDLVRRLAQAEASLARIRARPVVRASDALRRLQKATDLPTVAELRTAARRLARRAPSKDRPWS